MENKKNNIYKVEATLIIESEDSSRVSDFLNLIQEIFNSGSIETEFADLLGIRVRSFKEYKGAPYGIRNQI